MDTGSIKILVLVIFTLATLSISLSTNGSSSNIGCIESERQALLVFKQHLLDPANRLASWAPHEDCCRWWVGVVCHDVSGHVLELHLQNPPAYERSRLGGKINHSLLNLTHLSYLDLSHNYFGGIPIPHFFGSMVTLRHLNLSRAGFGGLIPHQLGNLSHMHYLNLAGDDYYKESPQQYVENLGWLAGMSQLKYLDMSNVDLNKALDWLQTVNMLPSLKELYLSHCHLPPQHSTLLSRNNLSALTLLVSLDLSFNHFGGPIPDGLQNLTSLRHLDLSHNYFNSSIPDWLYGFSPLEFLNLGSNHLQGQISSVIGNMTSAISLDLSLNNELEGGIPKSLGNLCNLKSVSLGGVKLSQNISDILHLLSFGCISHGLESLGLRDSQLFGPITGHIGYLKSLRKLDLSYNSIVGSIPESLGELFMLRVLYVQDNKLEGNLLESIGQLANLEEVFFSNNLLNGVISETHFENLTKLKTFSGSRNSFNLKVHPTWIPPFQVEILALGSWHLGPQIPPWLHSQKQLLSLDISNSGISDSIPSWFWNMSSQFGYLDASHNQIYGEIPYIPVQPFVSFDFSSNSFNGSLPRISSNLGSLDLSNNSLSGSLSSFLCHRMKGTMSLQYLILSGNFLISGELPHSLQNCTQLVILDMGENDLNGHIPTWLGSSFQDLEILNVRSNEFHGQIPNELCALASLRILDLSQNNLSGFLPKCIHNFSVMATPDDDGHPSHFLMEDDNHIFDVFSDYGSYVMKGNLLNYSTTLRLVRIIDLSNNNLSGEITEGVVNLQYLVSLNLSHNHLSGRIPKGIGAMNSLEALDFSQNQLSGSIPQSISNLTFLSYLNLSNNDLIGKIPSSTQISGFPASSFTGNQLCGPPLTQNCSAATGEINPSMRNEDKRDEVDWFYVAMGTGFGTGFGAFLVSLMVSRRWSRIYFGFLDRMWTRILLLYAKATRFHAV
ncbi:hypothetical protein COLO4_09595 [Corchorus olitorius]|uniref:Leucine-rich repeat-containing N-terminal plant-type domain-containing protein n=1 Tax=Corchorus olitorius TaxID=93759 RepID=A0A1R3KBK1_9ROSI|nr:hypothetical protein COLO4_09595 [Corchorus olitorius]